MSEQSVDETDLTSRSSDLLDPYEKLVSIQILDDRVNVPEKNRLLRCFQYLSINTISYGDFCWNGECTNCQIWYRMEGQNEESDRPALACRLECQEGMVITKLSRFIELEGITIK
jgi:hypothetical protein